MIESRFARPAAVCLLAALMAAGAARAEGTLAVDHALERRDWWPYATGPSYGAIAEDRLLDSRVIRLGVGSFDSRGTGLALPAPLRLSAEEASRPGAPWIVQLEGPITEAKKDALRARGVTLYEYVANNAFLVRTGNPSTLAGLPGVLWAAPYHPGYRIEPSLGKAPTWDAQETRNETIAARVLLFEPAERAGAVRALEALGASIDRETTFHPGEPADRVYFTARPEALLAASRLDAVRWVEETPRHGFVMNAETHVFMQSGGIASGTPLWDAGVTGSTQILGVMDSGCDVDTILLSNTATDAGTPGPTHRKVIAYTPYGGGDLQSCGNYTHGTNTTQCAVGNRSDFGQDGILDGVAKGAKLVFQDVGPTSQIDCALGGISTPSSLVPAWDEVRSKGGHLFNASLAICNYGTYGSHALDIDTYMWDHKDFLAFFSGGNGGSGNACPGTAKNLVSAGGHYQHPFHNTFYGSYGPSPDGRMGPHVSGPACDQSNGNPAPYNYNTSASLQSVDRNITGTPDAVLSQGSCGTSFSSPYLTGAAALIRDYFQKGFYPLGTASPADAFAPSGALVKGVLLNSGDFLTNNCGARMSSNQGGNTCGMGMGRANLSRTLAIAGDPRTPPGLRAIDRGMSAGLATGQSYEEWVEITDTSLPLRATVNWTDRPGSPLVNNLRLTVIGPSGGASQTWRGRNFDSSYRNGEWSRPESAGGTNDDGVNPNESVYIAAADLVPGWWKVVVSGTNVPSGDPNFGNTQPFALLLSGGFSSTGLKEVSPAGSVAPLQAGSASGANVTWQWEGSPDPAVVFNLYRGNLPASPASWSWNHGTIAPGHCGLASPATTVGDRLDGVSHYYLVGMKRAGREGSLGSSSNGSPRPAAAPACP